MASNQPADFDYTLHYFNFTKLCTACCSDQKRFKIALSAYDEDDRCKLTTKQKKSTVSCVAFERVRLYKIYGRTYRKVLNRKSDIAITGLLNKTEKRK